MIFRTLISLLIILSPLFINGQVTIEILNQNIIERNGENSIAIKKKPKKELGKKRNYRSQISGVKNDLYVEENGTIYGKISDKTVIETNENIFYLATTNYKIKVFTTDHRAQYKLLKFNKDLQLIKEQELDLYLNVRRKRVEYMTYKNNFIHIFYSSRKNKVKSLFQLIIDPETLNIVSDSNLIHKAFYSPGVFGIMKNEYSFNYSKDSSFFLVCNFNQVDMSSTDKIYTSTLDDSLNLIKKDSIVLKSKQLTSNILRNSIITNEGKINILALEFTDNYPRSHKIKRIKFIYSKNNGLSENIVYDESNSSENRKIIDAVLYDNKSEINIIGTFGNSRNNTTGFILFKSQKNESQKFNFTYLTNKYFNLSLTNGAYIIEHVHLTDDDKVFVIAEDIGFGQYKGVEYTKIGGILVSKLDIKLSKVEYAKILTKQYGTLETTTSSKDFYYKIIDENLFIIYPSSIHNSEEDNYSSKNIYIASFNNQGEFNQKEISNSDINSIKSFMSKNFVDSKGYSFLYIVPTKKEISLYKLNFNTY